VRRQPQVKSHSDGRKRIGGAAPAPRVKGRWEKDRRLVAPEGRAPGRKRGEKRRKKRGKNNKAPVGAYILGKNCHGRKRMRGKPAGAGRRTMVIFRLIFYVCPASEAPYRHSRAAPSSPSPCISLSLSLFRSHPLPFPSLPPPRIH